MIFKVHYNSALLKTGDSNAYISFCRRRLDSSRLEIHNFLYQHLYDRKIINFSQNMFSFEISPSSSRQVVIKCYVATGRTKWYCKLEELQSLKADPYGLNNDLWALQEKLIASLAAKVSREIREQIDGEILQDLNNAARGHQDNAAHNEEPAYYENFQNFYNANPLRRNLDYQGIARRALVVEPLPINYVYEPGAPINLDIALDAPIEADPIDE